MVAELHEVCELFEAELREICAGWYAASVFNLNKSIGESYDE